MVIEDGYITTIYRNREISGSMIVKAIDGVARHHHVYIRGSGVIKEIREITRKIIAPLIIIHRQEITSMRNTHHMITTIGKIKHT